MNLTFLFLLPILALNLTPGNIQYFLQNDTANTLYKEVDLNNDRTNEFLVIIKEKNKLHKICIFEKKDTLYHKSFESKSVSLWNLFIEDINNDGQNELLLVYNSSEHDKQKNNVAIYSWQDHQLLPVWRGSRLALPFDDITVMDIDKDKDMELVTISKISHTKSILNIYKWSNFNFLISSKKLFNIPYKYINNINNQCVLSNGEDIYKYTNTANGGNNDLQ
ncbi:MAG: hypothetical protein PHD29_00570 [bacterium]|nr:hypothetical protein [bacterium]MDD5756191.1 hypothetical protein [bacterium]